jgi:magnesium-transporting ATPase (P-type)
MRRLLNVQVLVRRLLGIETAGALSLLFVDKTGTLTKGQFDARAFLSAAGRAYDTADSLPVPLRTLTLIAMQEATPTTRHPESGQLLGGNASDHALLAWCHASLSPLPPGSVRTGRTILFNSMRKWAATELYVSSQAVASAPPLSFLLVPAGGTLSVFKGAPEALIPRCTRALGEGGQLNPFGAAPQAALDALVAAASRDGQRVIALALSAQALAPQADLPSELILLGVLILADEVRPGSAAALERCSRASMQLVMLTGDKAETAVAVVRLLPCDSLRLR